MVMFNSYDKLPEGKPASQIYQSGPNLGHLCCHQWNAEQEYWQCIGNEKFCWFIFWLTVLGAGKVELGVAVESRNHGEPVLKHLPSEISSVGTCANRLLSVSTSPTSIQTYQTWECHVHTSNPLGGTVSLIIRDISPYIEGLNPMYFHYPIS